VSFIIPHKVKHSMHKFLLKNLHKFLLNNLRLWRRRWVITYAGKTWLCFMSNFPAEQLDWQKITDISI